MKMNPGRLIQEVKRRQQLEELSDTKFAQKIGNSRQAWEAILKGKRQAGYKVWNGIMVAYPDLSDDILSLVDARVSRLANKKQRGNNV